ncbi:MAG: DUF4230 domain-containing protein [Synergistaceae bacterium]|jgi:hypothetical protein|nr:DUF4230 domain-containing protein [Synergistaceae bacterium]
MSTIKKIFIIVPITLAVTLGVGACIIYFGGKPSYQITKASVTTLVKEMPVQLVTNSVTTMVYCTIEDIPEYAGSRIKRALLGGSEGVFITTVKFGYGIDLKKDMNEDNVLIDEQSIIIALPEPKILYREINLDYEVYTKQTILRAVADKVTNTDIEKELRIVFQRKADEFAEKNGLVPTKDEIIESIQPVFNKLIAYQTDKQIIFK